MNTTIENMKIELRKKIDEAKVDGTFEEKKETLFAEMKKIQIFTFILEIKNIRIEKKELSIIETEEANKKYLQLARQEEIKKQILKNNFV